MDFGAAGADVRRYTFDDANHAALGLIKSTLSDGFACFAPDQRQAYAIALTQERPALVLSAPSAGRRAQAFAEPIEGTSYLSMDTDGIVDVSIKGPVFADVPRWLLYFFDVVGHNLLAEDLDHVPESARATRLLVSSPGGAVRGSDQSIPALAALTKRLPSAAHMAPAYSMGYWMAAQAQRLFVSKVDGAGSIGAVLTMYDYSGWLDQLGIKAIGLTSPNAEEKLDGWADAPITDEMIARIRVDLDDVGDAFQREMARKRGLPLAAIRALNGGTRMGKRALDDGLADAVGTPADARAYLIDQLKGGGSGGGTSASAAAGSTGAASAPNGAQPQTTREKPMNKTLLAALCALPGLSAMTAETFETDDGALKAAQAIKGAQTQAAKADSLEGQVKILDAEAKSSTQAKEAAEAALVAEQEKVASLEGQIKILSTQAEQNDWTAALASVKPEHRADVEKEAKRTRAEGQSPADAVNALKDHGVWGKAFSAEPPKLTEQEKKDLEGAGKGGETDPEAAATKIVGNLGR